MIISDKLTQFLVDKLQEEVETLTKELKKSRENGAEWMDHFNDSEDNNIRLIKENELLKFDLNNLDMGYDILREDHEVQHETLNLQAKSIISLQEEIKELVKAGAVLQNEVLELRKYKVDKESAKNVVGELMDEVNRRGGKREGAGRKKGDKR